MTARAATVRRRRVAMVMWGDVVEDFLAPIGWTLDDMLARMTGGWLFGYVDALARHDVEVVLLVFTRAPHAPRMATHVPSGTRVRLIPWSPAYRALRALLRDPYRWLAGDTPRRRGIHGLVCDLVPYLATPRRALRRVLAEEGCDAVLCQEYEEPRFDQVVACCRELGIPAFATFQGATQRRSRLEEARRPLSLARAAGFIIGASRERQRVADAYGLRGDRVARIFNPLDDQTWFPERTMATRAELGVPPDAVLVAWHGRVVVAGKGLDTLLDAWRRARQGAAGPRLHLLLVGTGGEAAQLRARVDEEPGGITWVDRYIADRALMRRYLSCADVYAMPSRREGFPMAPLEAMACGLPVIASRVAGIDDIFPQGEENGGIVVPIGDAGALAAQVERLALDASLRARLGARALARVREAFHPGQVGQQLAEFLFRS